MAPVLGYWKIRGLAQSIRYLLEYLGEDYEETLYDCGPAPDFDRSSWLNVKPTLGLPLPNLPYYIDGDVKLTQSYAIMRYLGRKHKLCGQDEKQVMMVDMLMDQGRDIHLHFGILCYFNYTPEKKKEYLEKLPDTLKLLADLLGQQQWFVGDKMTLADFVLYEELDIQQALDSKCLDGFPTLKAFLKRFEDLPAIKKFMASPRFIKNQINMPMAQFHSIGQS